MNRSASIRAGFAALVLVATLGGCDEIDEMLGIDSGSPAANTVSTTTTNTTTSTTGSTTGSTADSGGPKPGAGSNPALEAEMAQAASVISAQLPMRVDSITTLNAVRAEGTEFVYDMAISQPIPPGQLDAFRTAMQTNNQTNLCRDVNTSRFIRNGGSMRHNYTDTNGVSLQTHVTACP